MGATVPGAIPAHAPEPTRARRLLGRFHVTGVFWYRLHDVAVRAVPSWALGPVILPSTAFFFVFLLRIRRAIAGNLEPVLGPCGVVERQRRIWRTMWNFAWCLSERYERHSTRRPFAMDTEGLDMWHAASSKGRGLVLVTAHVGNFEAGSLVPASVERRHVHLVREPEVDPRAQEYIRRLLESIPNAHFTTHFQGEDPLQGMTLLEALRRNEIVAMQGDRPRTGARNVETELFGRPFPIAAGPAALARSAGAPILPVFVFREGRRHYRIVFRPAIEPCASDDRNADLQETTRRIAREVEWALRERPHQWFCFRDVFGGDQRAGSTARERDAIRDKC